MDRAVAYELLASELQLWRDLPYAEVAKQIDTKVNRPATVGTETIEIVVSVRWHSVERQQIEVLAVAFGPSCWSLQRLEERLLISPDGPNSYNTTK